METLNNNDAMAVQRAKINGNFTELYTHNTAFAYVSTPVATLMSTADTWYLYKSTFVNSLEGVWEEGTYGIKIASDASELGYEIEFQTGGTIDKNSIVEIGIVKNGVYNATSGIMESGTFLDGSNGGASAKTAGDYVNPRCFWQGHLAANDEVALVIKCATSNATFTPLNGSTSAHQAK